MTTIGTQFYPVTPAGQVVSVLLMLYALGIFSYFVSSIASVLVGSDSEDQAHERERAGITLHLTQAQASVLRSLLNSLPETGQ